MKPALHWIRDGLAIVACAAGGFVAADVALASRWEDRPVGRMGDAAVERPARMKPAAPRTRGANHRAAFADVRLDPPPITLPPLGTLDLAAIAARDERPNRPGALRRAVHRHVSQLLTTKRGCLPTDLPPTILRVHVKIHSRAGGIASVNEISALEVQRGAPLPAATTACLLAALRARLPAPISDASAAFPEFDGDAMILAGVGMDASCRL